MLLLPMPRLSKVQHLQHRTSLGQNCDRSCRANDGIGRRYAMLLLLFAAYIRSMVTVHGPQTDLRPDQQPSFLSCY